MEYAGARLALDLLAAEQGAALFTDEIARMKPTAWRLWQTGRRRMRTKEAGPRRIARSRARQAGGTHRRPWSNWSRGCTQATHEGRKSVVRLCDGDAGLQPVADHAAFTALSALLPTTPPADHRETRLRR